MSDFKGVAVYCEVKDNTLLPIATEGLGIGRKLADSLSQELSAIVAGSGIGGLAGQAISYGADKVYTINDPQLKDYQTDSYTLVMEKVVNQAKPQVLIMGQTSMGRDLAPRLSFRLGTAVTLLVRDGGVPRR